MYISNKSYQHGYDRRDSSTPTQGLMVQRYRDTFVGLLLAIAPPPIFLQYNVIHSESCLLMRPRGVEADLSPSPDVTEGNEPTGHAELYHDVSSAQRLTHTAESSKSQTLTSQGITALLKTPYLNCRIIEVTKLTSQGVTVQLIEVDQHPPPQAGIHPDDPVKELYIFVELEASTLSDRECRTRNMQFFFDNLRVVHDRPKVVDCKICCNAPR
ncbi:hypothetical protein JB92DRAFT_3094093 [Gautieria morchelliformis]|nr:hypothetical protein JB92DRAFT_3094093 [Gautieria morchelliformis]